MTRKEILRLFSLGAAAPLLPLSLSSCAKKVEIATSGQATPENSFSLLEMTISDLQKQMESGAATSASITQNYLDRIAALDKMGPGLNAVLELNPDAIQLAQELDQERQLGKLRGPLHGIPVMLKGNIDTGDRMHTSAGALVLKDWIAGEDAFLVKQLRNAGAVILGKTNLSEWANFRSTRSSSGWSGILGQTRNPYVLDRSPCGSSSGSGVAVAANLCAVAVGTETDGSIVCPSTMNGIVGIKPTLGLVSRRGVIPISESCDTAGPMARTVEDAALLLNGMVGIDAQDPNPLGVAPSIPLPDFAANLLADGLKGKRIGIARSFFGFHKEVDQLMDQAIEDIRQQGAELIELPDFALPDQAGSDQWLVLKYEFRTGLEAYFSKLPEGMGIRSLKDLIAFNQANKESSMPYFGQEIVEMSLETESVPEEEYLQAKTRMRRLAGPETIDKAMLLHDLDAILAPTGGPAWAIDLVNGDHFVGGSSSPAAVAGYPNITVPAGFIHGLPVGISFFGTAFSEPKLLQVAYAYEQATQHRKAPEFKPRLH